MLAQLIMSLTEKLEVLKTLDLTAEDDEADTYKGDMYAVMDRLEEFTARAACHEPPATVRPPAVIKF